MWTNANRILATMEALASTNPKAIPAFAARVIVDLIAKTKLETALRQLVPSGLCARTIPASETTNASADPATRVLPAT